ncbi:Nuclease EXOG, mitochondrial [Tupaia chinensis]|uniref:Nuclease EXOG, mitochondrial n=1 Tax=Tupaia chinensis TaxID=246437 RepID=L8Y2D0_TUPCH|nr:Nuclease EXOG, mitochondrial [Tupaia chinensis]
MKAAMPSRSPQHEERQTRYGYRVRVRYAVIGEDNVAVPSHLYKVILARRSPDSTEPLALGAFVVPNEAIGFQPQLTEFQVSLQELEKLSGLVFFPHLDRNSNITNICSVDTCRLLDFQEFTLYLSTRKIEGARSVGRLEKVMEHLKNVGIKPDDYFLSRYERKLQELKTQEQSGSPGGKLKTQEQPGTPGGKLKTQEQPGNPGRKPS